MDEPAGLGPIPELDEYFVLGAVHREPSHRDRQVQAERSKAELRAGRYRAELDRGLEAARRHRRPPRHWRSGRPPRSTARPPSRKRQILGLVIAAAVIAAAVVPQYLSGHRPAASFGLPAFTSRTTTCSNNRYPSGAEYRFERCDGGQPVGWERCTTLSVSVNPTNAPVGWQADVANAVDQVSRTTGLHLKTISTGSGSITVAWAATLMLPGAVTADKAGLTRVLFRSDAAASNIAAANVQISSHLVAGGGHSGELPVLLHELGHAVGLGHFDGPEVMNPIDQGYSTFQSGDIAGLASLYRPSTCG